MNEFSAALIAGGRSRRMGTDKAFLAWQGRPLWEHQWEKLRALHPRQLLLSCRREQPFPPDLTAVHDEWPDCGPLGGIASCLRVCTAPLLTVLGIDLPLLPGNFLDSLLGECSEGCGAVIFSGEFFEPLVAVYPREMLALAEEQIGAGRLSMQDFVRSGVESGLMRVAQVPVELQWFTNLNAPADFPTSATP